MGTPNIDLSLFHARWLHEELGLNVLLPVQPLHGRRRGGAPKGTTYPAGDLLDNVHGAAQAVWDVRRALSLDPVARTPAPAIGLTGVSLGGYVGSPGRQPRARPGVRHPRRAPVVDLVDLMEDHARATPAHDLRPLLEPARRIGRVVSPLAMSPGHPARARATCTPASPTA